VTYKLSTAPLTLVEAASVLQTLYQSFSSVNRFNKKSKVIY